MSKRVSIADIARILDVSKTTVSFILNGKAEEKRISDEVVERVQKLVSEIGYEPNALAKSLRTGKSNLIGFMIDDIADTFFACIARLIEEKAHQKGYNIIYCSTTNDAEKAHKLIAMLRNRHVDGFIVAASENIKGVISELERSGLPVVTFDGHLLLSVGAIIKDSQTIDELANDLIDRLLQMLDTKPVRANITNF